MNTLSPPQAPRIESGFDSDFDEAPRSPSPLKGERAEVRGDQENQNLTLAEAAKRLRCRPSDVPLRRRGEAEGIGYFMLRRPGQTPRIRIPLVEIQDWERRNTLKPLTGIALTTP